MILLIERWSD